MIVAGRVFDWRTLVIFELLISKFEKLGVENLLVIWPDEYMISRSIKKT